MSVSPTIIPLLNGPFAENCYLVAPPGSREAIIVDPGAEPALFLTEAARHRLAIREIWLTHGHIDHVSGVGAIHQATGAPIFLHPADRPLYDGLVQQAALFGLEVSPAPPPDHDLTHGQRLRFGSMEFEVRHAPGHTPGHVCFVGHGIVLGGDVLFQGSIGRTDLPGGNHAQLLRSIRQQLFTLPDDTVVYPGHGPVTTVGAERRTNPFLLEQGT
jgi:glyoxylase-like metal-dependent hydrolase (beta-lactamase superfamily II)